jgi:hypothetical protein
MIVSGGRWRLEYPHALQLLGLEKDATRWVEEVQEDGQAFVNHINAPGNYNQAPFDWVSMSKI